MSAGTCHSTGGTPAAAPAVKSDRLERLQLLTYTAIRKTIKQGMTAHEVSLATGIDRHSIQPPIFELRRNGLMNPAASGDATLAADRRPFGLPLNLLTALRSRRLLPDRTILVPHQNARAFYCMAHANLSDCPHSGAFVVLRSAFETSPNPHRGEVSKSPLDGKSRGGVRNRADRESWGLTAPQIASLTAAELMARKIGLPFNRFITLAWQTAGLPLEDMAKATGRFIDQLTRWLARRGHRTAWIWVHENAGVEGGHCHLLAHVPPECVDDLTCVVRRWLSKITGRRYRANLVKSISIGGRLGMEVGNPDLHLANLETVMAYVVKQSDAVAMQRFHQPGGRVIGKRCGSSQNIGAKSRSSSRRK